MYHTIRHVLGIKGSGHDTAAAIVVDGEPVAAVAQERWDRVKHSRQPPREAIKFCLRKSGLELKDIDAIAVQYNYVVALYNFVPSIILNHGPHAWKSFFQHLKDKFTKWIAVQRLLRKELKFKGAIYFLDHHDCHAASAFFTSPFEKAAVLSVDGKGEIASTILYFAEGTQLRRLAEVPYPHSIGFLYSKITSHLGFKHDSDEGKIMALSAFGNKPIKKFNTLITLNNRKLFRLNLEYLKFHLDRKKDFSEKFENEIGGFPRSKDDPLTQYHKNLAFSLQRTTEEVLLFLSNKLFELTNTTNLCVVGGVGLNAIAAGKLARESKFENLYIFPAAGDDGSALGAALLCYYMFSNNRRHRKRFSPYLGPEFSDDHIYEILKRARIQFYYVKDILLETAKFLAEGKIVGWFQGRAEFGPRALGNRSILADPRLPHIKDLLNMKVKFRESFRPFAPAVLEEKMDEYFEFWKPSPFMNFAFKVLEGKMKTIPAVVHVDGTSRVQTVSSMDNPLFYELLKMFKRFTGLGVILNTSMNIKGEPIVNTPEEAIKLLEKTEIDYLIIGNYIVCHPNLMEIKHTNETLCSIERK